MEHSGVWHISQACIRKQRNFKARQAGTWDSLLSYLKWCVNKLSQVYLDRALEVELEPMWLGSVETWQQSMLSGTPGAVDFFPDRPAAQAEE